MLIPTGAVSSALRYFVPLVVTLFGIASTSQAACAPGTQDTLRALLSNSSSVSSTIPANFRWSQYPEPDPSLYIKVGKEGDISRAVRFAKQRDYPFLVQNGGNGWAETFSLTGCGLLLDISSLRDVSFSNDRTTATIQGGISVQEVVAAAASNNARVSTATCNCLGFLGAALGGGQSRTAGLYGLSVDQLISATIVLASGEEVHASANTHPDLWWAIRGAGPNFGIVTSAVIKAYPVPPEQNVAYQAFLTFSGDKIAKLMHVLSEIELQPDMQFDFVFQTSGAPLYTPEISVVPFFLGNESAARAAFASIFNVGPSNITGGELPYSEWNLAGSAFCKKGLRKPGHGATLAHIDAETWINVYRAFEIFVASENTAFEASTILSENYPVANASATTIETSSYPFRALRSFAIITPTYNDSSLDMTAIAWAAQVRSMLWETAGTTHNSSYINFARGDETLSTIYGRSLPLLKQLKAVYDPQNRFNQWFPLIKG